MKTSRQWWLATGFLIVAVSVSATPNGVQLVDDDLQPVADAVIAIYGDGTAPTATINKRADVDQVDRQFTPYVSVVEAGTRVYFPNSDDIRHHVYSFSPAKRFELRLYHGTTAEPVVFEQAGKVVLGCNIHDDMIGYIYVVDTPYYAVTDVSGAARFVQLPEGNLRYQVQHPQLAEPVVGELSAASELKTINVGRLLPDPRKTKPRTELEALFDR